MLIFFAISEAEMPGLAATSFTAWSERVPPRRRRRRVVVRLAAGPARPPAALAAVGEGGEGTFELRALGVELLEAPANQAGGLIYGLRYR